MRPLMLDELLLRGNSYDPDQRNHLVCVGSATRRVDSRKADRSAATGKNNKEPGVARAVRAVRAVRAAGSEHVPCAVCHAARAEAYRDTVAPIPLFPISRFPERASELATERSSNPT